MKVDKLDEIGRRKRMARNPTGKRVGVSERVLVLLERLHWFGRLPTGYLYEFTKDLPHAKDRTGLIKVLGDLFHERTFRLLNGDYLDLPRGSGLLDRPYQQTVPENWLSNELTHSINEHSLELLENAGRLVPNVYKPSGPYEHQLFGSMTMAAVALEASRDKDLQFNPQHTIIDTPQPHYELDGVSVKNDGICSVTRLSTGRTFYLFIENDRDTEATKMTTDKSKSWERTVIQMKHFIGSNLYKKYVGAKKGDMGFLLNLTVNPGHMEEMIKVVRKHFPSGCNYILSQYYREFGKSVNPPDYVMPLLTGTWKRAGMEDVILIK